MAVFEIAKALDIIEIRHEPLTNIEGALVTTPERSEGVILVNKNSSARRRRFTAGHELLHFLSPGHKPTSPEGFWCSRRDMSEHQLDAADRHRRQEAEANLFAIELLAPQSRIKQYLDGAPDLAAVRSMSSEMNISKAAAARRYVACHRETLAVVFSRDGRLHYFESSEDCPPLRVRRGLPIPDLPADTDDLGLTSMSEAAADEWLARSVNIDLAVQTLYQQNGHAITLLHVSSIDEDDDGGIEDTYARFNRFGE